MTGFEIRDHKDNLIAASGPDNPLPRQGELVIDGTDMYRVSSIQHEYLRGRRQKTVVLVEFVADISVGGGRE